MSRGKKQIEANQRRQLEAAFSRMETDEKRGCHDKVGHQSKRVAEHAAERLRVSDRRRGDRQRRVDVYRCGICTLYHVGHTAWPKRRS